MPESSKAKPTQPRRLQDVKHWDIETDVAIIGFGGAGACAAIEAHDTGAETILFELSSASGGSTALSSAEIYMGGNGGTRVQNACGFEDSTEDMFNYMMMSAGEKGDKTKIRTYCDNSKAHFDWLVEQGVPYKNSMESRRAVMALGDDCLLYTSNEKAWPFNQHAKPCPRGHNLQIEGDNGGPLLMKILTEQVESRGIRVEYDARALTLIIDDARNVHGIVIRINQKEHHIKTRKGVVLCAGGFVMNDAMVKKYAPKLLKANYQVGNPGDTGSGILMGMGVGANTLHMDEGFISMPFYPPEEMTLGIFVNSQGQRFINEDCYHSRVGYYAMQQISDRIYLVFSAEDFKQPPFFLGADFAGTGDTIEELEHELEVAPGSLVRTIEYYNLHAAEGKDPLFHKAGEWLKPLNAPYAALDVTPGRGAILPYFTFGGLETLPTGEVLTPEGDIIEGLFAAGRTACGIPRTAAGYGSGMSVGDATFFGRMAGKTVAKQ